MAFMAGGLFCVFYGMLLLVGSAKKLPPLPTAGKWKMSALGTGLTALLQSSSALSCAVCAMTEAGTFTLGQAYALLIGTNVGTTLTPVLTSLGLGIGGENMLIFPLLGLAFLLLRPLLPKISEPICGFCLMMWGLLSISYAAPALTENWDSQVLYRLFSSPMLGWLIGFAVTALLQCSSVTVSLLQIVSLRFPLTRAMVIPVLLGQNIGTTSTALLATLSASPTAKRCARYHFFFNVVGCLWCFPLWWVCKRYLGGSADTMFIALFHVTFNTINAVLHLLLDPRIK